MKILKYLKYLSLIAEVVERATLFLGGQPYSANKTLKVEGKTVLLEIKATVISTDGSSTSSPSANTPPASTSTSTAPSVPSVPSN
jgi:hypothetical protein